MSKKVLNNKSESSSDKVISLSFKQAMGFLVFIPVVIVLFFSVTSINEELRLLKELRPLSNVTQLSFKVGSYIHEMQKERGATGGFMGSDGANFNNVLKDQRRLTDNRRKDLDEFLKTFVSEDFGEDFVNIFNIAFAEYDKLDDLRQKVSSLSIPDSEGISFYTQHNNKMLDVVRLISSQTSPDVKLTEDINAYLAFIEGKEKAGEERAIMTNTFAADKFDEGVADRFLFLVHAQEIYFDAFSWYASQEQIDFFDEKTTDPVVAEVERMRDVAFSRDEGFSINALHWFLTTTSKINLMQNTADKILSDVINRADLLEEEAQNKLRIVIISMIVILLVALSLSIYLTNSISSRLSKLKEGADIIGKGNLGYKVGTDDKDEIGQLSREFDKMTDAIKQSRAEIDKKVKEQTKEIIEQKKEVDKAVTRAKSINEAMTGRELKMIEMKKEIADLKHKVKNNN